MTASPFPLPLRGLEPITLEQLTARILAVWHRATDAQRERGSHWYPAAHTVAAGLAGGDARRGAGVIAALSAQCPWDRNITLARALCADQPVATVRERVLKAHRILAGADPLEVLPQGIKTWHFFRCIAEPADAWAVVIDRHAHDIAMGARYGNRPRGLGYRPRYDVFADAYRRAAGQLAVLPSTVQATCWVVWTEAGW